jgi:hypothetical protein
MISLLYVSRAVFPAASAEGELQDILTTARARNPKLGVTGALLHMDGLFAQVLEGEAPPVNQLMIDILRDRRHSEVRIIEVMPVTKRRFEGWSMAQVTAAAEPRALLAALTNAGPDARMDEASAALLDYMAGAARDD